MGKCVGVPDYSATDVEMALVELICRYRVPCHMCVHVEMLLKDKTCDIGFLAIWGYRGACKR